MNTKIKLLLGRVATVAVLGGATATGLAYADPTPPTPTPTPTPSANPSPGSKGKAGHRSAGGHGLLGRALHGEATVTGGKKAAAQTLVVVFQRGTVTKIDKGSVEVRSEDGFTATYQLGTAIKVRKDKAEAGIAEVKPGQQVRLVAAKQGETLTAKRLVLLG